MGNVGYNDPRAFQLRESEMKSRLSNVAMVAEGRRSMKRRLRLLRVAKWGGLGLSVIALLLWLSSAVWMIEYRWSRGTSIYGISITAGCVGVLEEVKPDLFLSGEDAIQDERQRPRQLREIAANSWRVQRQDTGGLWMNWPALWAGELGGTVTYVPFWMPFIVIMIPTAILWWCDRPPRLRPGHCTCGYNLTGNVSGTCPECGRETSNTDA